MSTNAFRATSTGNDPVGLCFEPVIALANHACSPNAAIIFDGRKIILRALDPIKENDQIFISYIDGTQRRETRQAELKEAYFFTCNCDKCAKDETPYQTWMRCPHGVRILFNAFEHLLTLMSSSIGIANSTFSWLRNHSTISHVPRLPPPTSA